MSPSQLSDDALFALISKAQESTKTTKLSTENVFARLGKIHELFAQFVRKPDSAALIYSDPVSDAVTWKAIGERLVVGRWTTVSDAEVISFLHVNDDEMSRRHFEITHQGDGIYAIRDLESTNGLYLNEVEEQNALLVSGTEIRAGQTNFVFVGT